VTCPHCDSPVAVTDTAGNPWYNCGSTKTFRSMSCLDREPLATKLHAATERIKHLEASLHRIANQDYRGNRSTESQIAFEALKP
jgi:hypothetical protein